MKVVADTPRGWMHYVKDVTIALTRSLTDDEYKLVMKCYIGGKPYTKAAEEIQNAGN